jgi:DNA invertase Pin-like site-specific DNA recombinase
MNVRHLRPEDLAGRRWRGLVRESSERQAEMWSPERQRNDLRRAASDLGLIEVPPAFYERTGSGEAEGVSELRTALADGRAGAYDVLLVLHTSRFARNRAEAVEMKRQFRKAGIVIYFVAQRIISGTYVAGLSEGISEVIDEQENEQRRMWIAGGMRERQLAGHWIGRIPYGYRRRLADFPDGTRGWDGGLEIEPTEAEGVRWAFNTWLAGAPYRAIALGLNAYGHRTRMGEPWAIRTAKVMLRNPVYTGRLVRYRRHHPDHYFPEGDEHDGNREIGRPFPAILTDEVFEAALARDRHFSGSGPRRHDYPLSPILRCAACGRRMTGAGRDARRYYRCTGRSQFGDCEAPSARADHVEAEVAHWLSALELPQDWRTEIARLEVREAAAGEAERKRRLEERAKRLRDLYAWNELEADEFKTKMAEVRGEMAVMAKPSIGGLAAAADALRDIGVRFAAEDADPAAKRAVAALIFRDVQVTDGRVSAFNLRAEVRPLIEMCRLLAGPCPCARCTEYAVRYVA